VLLGTDYLRADTLVDADGDGASNGDEVEQHTDPRSSDASSHLGNAYRYRKVEDEGLVTEPLVLQPRRIKGVSVLLAGADTTAGLGTLRYTAGPPARLSWQDAIDDAPGAEVVVSEPGEYQLLSSSTISGEIDRSLTVRAEPLLYPPGFVQELLLVEMSERYCRSFEVSNIRLVETSSPTGEGGQNDVFIYFAEAAKGRLTLPGLFRVAHIPVIYHPDTGREPSDLVVEIRDDEFFSIGLDN
jgi:hypothetical protein